MKKPSYLTKEGAEKLRSELKHLEGPVRQDLAKRLRAAIQMGDLSENADYSAAKEEQGFIEGPESDWTQKPDREAPGSGRFDGFQGCAGREAVGHNNEPG